MGSLSGLWDPGDLGGECIWVFSMGGSMGGMLNLQMYTRQYQMYTTVPNYDSN